MRFSNEFGTGTWSAPSAAFRTDAGGPSSPAAPVVVSVSGVTASLSWAAPEAHGSSVLDYEVQHRFVNSVQEQLWVDAPSKVSGLVGLNRAERQLIRTTAPFGASVTGGHFVLAFVYDGLMDRDPEGKSKTDPIPFNATEEETDVVASHTAVEGLLEHFDAGDGRHLDVWTETNDFDGVADRSDNGDGVGHSFGIYHRAV